MVGVARQALRPAASRRPCRSSGQRSPRDNRAQLPCRQAQDAVDRQAPAAEAGQAHGRFRVILRETLHRAEVGRPEAGGVLDLEGPDTGQRVLPAATRPTDNTGRQADSRAAREYEVLPVGGIDCRAYAARFPVIASRSPSRSPSSLAIRSRSCPSCPVVSIPVGVDPVSELLAPRIYPVSHPAVVPGHDPPHAQQYCCDHAHGGQRWRDDPNALHGLPLRTLVSGPGRRGRNRRLRGGRSSSGWEWWTRRGSNP